MSGRNFFKSIVFTSAASVSPQIFIPKFEPVRWKPMLVWYYEEVADLTQEGGPVCIRDIWITPDEYRRRSKALDDLILREEREEQEYLQRIGKRDPGPISLSELKNRVDEQLRGINVYQT